MIQEAAVSDDVEQVRNATDLVALISEHVRLEPKGREHVGLCPFHDDGRPSMSVVTHRSTAFYKCFACGASGDCFTFLQKHLNWSFPEALTHLAERAGITLSSRGGDRDQADRERAQARRTWLRKSLEQADAWFRTTLDGKAGAQARDCIARRGISDAMVERFGLGAAPEGWQNLHDALVREDMPVEVLVAAGLLKQKDASKSERCYDAFRNRLMFPIYDDAGQPVAFGGRDLGDDGPKYLNSAEHDLFKKGRLLYGMHLARPAMRQSGRGIVAEGYTDVIACHAAGFEETVGTLGTAFTDDHARTLLRQVSEVVLLFDGDEAGRRAADRAVGIAMRHVLDVRICVLPEGQDPDDMLRSPEGTAQFREALDAAMDALDWCLQRSGIAKTSPGSAARQQRLQRLLDDLAAAGLDRTDALRRDMLVTRIAELAGVQTTTVLRGLAPAVGTSRPKPIVHDAQGPPGDATLADASFTDQSLAAIERELLAVALAAVACDQSADTVFDQLTMPNLRAIAQAALSLRQSNRPVDIPHLHDELLDDAHRRLATDLVESGHSILESHAQAGEDAATAINTLIDRLTQRRTVAGVNTRISDWRTGGGSDANAAADLIEALRATGRRATALPRPAGG